MLVILAVKKSSVSKFEEDYFKNNLSISDRITSEVFTFGR